MGVVFLMSSWSCGEDAGNLLGRQRYQIVESRGGQLSGRETFVGVETGGQST